jgi:hypothetical protein
VDFNLCRGVANTEQRAPGLSAVASGGHQESNDALFSVVFGWVSKRRFENTSAGSKQQAAWLILSFSCQGCSKVVGGLPNPELSFHITSWCLAHQIGYVGLFPTVSWKNLEQRKNPCDPEQVMALQDWQVPVVH